MEESGRDGTNKFAYANLFATDRTFFGVNKEKFLFNENTPDVIFIKMDRRGRRSLHGEIEICLPSPYGESNTNKIIPFFVGTGVLDSPLFVNIGRTLFVQKIKIMNTLKTAVGGFSVQPVFT